MRSKNLFRPPVSSACSGLNLRFPPACIAGPKVTAEHAKLALDVIGLQERKAAVGLGDGALREERASGAEDSLRRRDAMDSFG